MKPNKEQLTEILERGVEKVFPNSEFLKARLVSGEQLKLYLGIDPTADTLHVGHAIVLGKLKQFQELGHEIVLLIGDFTGMIGDPTGKSATRRPLTREEVLNNAKLYKKQASKFIKFTGPNAAKIKYNSRWLDKLNFHRLIEVASRFTVQQLLERDMFQERLKKGQPIALHEFLYPLMQGYDALAMEVDGEVGGNDQMFNMLVGRDLIKAETGKEKFVITMKLLTDTAGVKMGKSEGNMIKLNDSSTDMYGKVMSWNDGMILPAWELLTAAPVKKIGEVAAALKQPGVNPRDLKMALARAIVTEFHGAKKAVVAEKDFIAMFQKHDAPAEIRTVSVRKQTIGLIDALVFGGLCATNGEARRVIEQGGVKVDGETVLKTDALITVNQVGTVLQKGKRHFARLVF